MSCPRIAIIVTPAFDGSWPFAADHAYQLVRELGQVSFHRLDPEDERRPQAIVPAAQSLEHLILFGLRLAPADLTGLPALRSLVSEREADAELITAVESHSNIRLISGINEAKWGQSVAEYTFALVLAALRRIPQLHAVIRASHAAWDYAPDPVHPRPSQRGYQFGDDPAFVNGTLHGKRVRIAGLGNIGVRFARFCHAFKADVAAWDPMQPDNVFAAVDAERRRSLVNLASDADVFVPLVPLRKATRGMIDADCIAALPRGSLVVQTTRAEVCDMLRLRERVLADELALAADVFDQEPLPLDDPLLSKPQVITTPHNAGRTAHASQELARLLLDPLLEDLQHAHVEV